MTDQMHERLNKLAEIIERYTKKDGSYATAVPSLFFGRSSSMTGPHYGIHKTSFCFVVQGKKEIWLAQDCLKYGTADYLITSVDLPFTAKVVEASPEVPYLSLKLEFTSDQILDVLNNFKIRPSSRENASRAVYISKTDSSLLDAITRLVNLLDTPDDIPVLAPLFIQEIIYRVLQGEFGATLEQIAVKGSNSYLIRDVIKKIMDNFDQPIKINELAKTANMSTSSLHRHFKEVTAMSPIQFQKQIRLQEARRLLLSEPTDAADVAFRVGYESPSQFSREYSRMFGSPPIEDIKNFRKQYEV